MKNFVLFCCILFMSFSYAEEPQILPLARMGNPILHQKANKITNFQDPEFLQTISNMQKTFESLEFAAGLAAPQVHIPSRIILVSLPKEIADEFHPEGLPLTVMINPKWTNVSPQENLDWEICFSLVDLMGEVPRFDHILFSYQTPEGNIVQDEAKGFFARLIQHECDHLDGILYPQRVKDFNHFGYREEIVQFYK